MAATGIAEELELKLELEGGLEHRRASTSHSAMNESCGSLAARSSNSSCRPASSGGRSQAHAGRHAAKELQIALPNPDPSEPPIPDMLVAGLLVVLMVDMPDKSRLPGPGSGLKQVVKDSSCAVSAAVHCVSAPANPERKSNTTRKSTSSTELCMSLK